MNNIILPIIKNVVPADIAKQICSVQPMTEDATVLYQVKRLPRLTWVIDENKKRKEPKQGDSRHEFSRGWTIYYGTEWIPYDVWLKIKIAGL